MSIKLSSIEFKAGSTSTDKHLSIPADHIIILVGPNNSGKSLALREIESICSGQHLQTKVVENAMIDYPKSADDVIELMRQFETSPPNENSITPGNFWVGQHTFSSQTPERNFELNVPGLRNAVQNGEMNLIQLWVSAFFTTRLDGRTRFLLTDPKNTGDLQLHPKNHLWALFKDDKAREQVRELTEKAFGLHFVIDPTGMTKFRIRMSHTKPLSQQEEQGLDNSAREFHRKAEDISTLSDGVQAYVGLVSAVMSLNHKILLIDEPEAFLHPPLSRRLGTDLTKIAKERSASIIISTHSAPFVMGCVETSENVTIVRLTYENSIASARKLDSMELKDILKSSLLRSTGVIQGLFHRAVIVGESDADRAFYDEINRRLLMNDRGIADALFLNAQNMQTVYRLVGPLRRLGIPAVAIVDLDYITQTGANWTQLLSACQIPDIQRLQLDTERTYFEDIFSKLPLTEKGARAIKDGGINRLNPTDKIRLEKFLSTLSEYGLFLVQNGELESWLSSLQVSGHGTAWLINMFNAIGDNDDAGNFLRPTDEDVWIFIDKIAKWVRDSSRKGV